MKRNGSNQKRGKGWRSDFAASAGLLFWDWPTLLLFELIYKFIMLFIWSCTGDLFQTALDQAGMEYVTNGNVVQLFTNPISILLLVLLVLILAWSVLVEMAAIIIYIQKATAREKTTPFKLLYQAAKRSMGIFIPRNLPMILYILLAVPLSGIILTSGSFRSFQIPEFIGDFIMAQLVLRISFYLFMAGLLYLTFLWLFSIPEMILNKTGFKAAHRTSRAMMKKRKLSIFWRLLSSFAAAALLGAAIYFVLLLSWLIFAKLSMGGQDGYYMFWQRLQAVQSAGKLLASVCIAAGNFSMITFLYLKYQKNTAVQLERKNNQSWKKRIIAVLIAAGLLFVYVQLEREFSDSFFSNEEQVQILAHRGGALFAPENTVSALKNAVDSGAEYAEIDVQQTKDRGLVVMHDTSFKRTSGINKNVWEVTLEEAVRYPAGLEYKRQGYEGEKICSLEDMIKQAEGKIKLMIELKSSGHEKDLEKEILEMIKKYHFTDQCIIASMDYQILEKIKELEPAQETVYISVVAYGYFSSMSAADGISVEATFANIGLKNRLAAMEKDLYVWTVNEDRSIQRTLALHPRGLITDNPYLARYYLDSGNTGFFASLIEVVSRPEKMKKD